MVLKYLERLRRSNLDALYKGIIKETRRSYPWKYVVFAVCNDWVSGITAKIDYDTKKLTPEYEQNPFVRPFLEEAGSTGFLYHSLADSIFFAGVGLLPIPKKIKIGYLIYAGLSTAYSAVGHTLGYIASKGIYTETLQNIYEIMYQYQPERIIPHLLEKLF